MGEGIDGEVRDLDRIQRNQLMVYGTTVEPPTRDMVRGEVRDEVDLCLKVLEEAPAKLLVQKKRKRKHWMVCHAADMVMRKLQLFALQRHASLLGVDISGHDLEAALVRTEARLMRDAKERSG